MRFYFIQFENATAIYIPYYQIHSSVEVAREELRCLRNEYGFQFQYMLVPETCVKKITGGRIDQWSPGMLCFSAEVKKLWRSKGFPI